MNDNIPTLAEATAQARPYAAEVQRRLKALADPHLKRYDRGLYTFEDLVLALTEIDDARVYEEVAADPAFG